MVETGSGGDRPRYQVSPTAILADVPLFAALTGEQLDYLARRLRRRTYKPREVIFHRDDPGEALYLVSAGSVRIYLPSTEGEEALLAVLHPGDYFGEVALLDGLPRSASAVVIENTELLLLYRDDFWQFLRECPQAVEVLLKALAALVRRDTDRLEDALFLGLPARLAKRLLELSERYGEKTSRGIEIRTPITQGELAGLVGATRESVNRALGQLRDAGILHWEGRRYVVLKPQDLRMQVELY
jgi:CRP/FNR family cyclic AMP-dependent transcriptional regulator